MPFWLSRLISHNEARKTELFSTNIGSLEEKIPASIFKRISKTHIINIDYLYKAGRKKKRSKKFSTGRSRFYRHREAGFLVLENKFQYKFPIVPLSRGSSD